MAAADGTYEVATVGVWQILRLGPDVAANTMV
jgi:hypothetical protein